MTLDEVQDLLTGEFGLLPDLREYGNGRSYFWREVRWIPASTTRIVRVHYDAGRIVTHLKLSVSSDNNNSVLVQPPFDEERLRAAIADEIALFRNTERGQAGGLFG